jgi:hypothetical protein
VRDCECLCVEPAIVGVGIDFAQNSKSIVSTRCGHPPAEETRGLAADIHVFNLIKVVTIKVSS